MVVGAQNSAIALTQETRQPIKGFIGNMMPTPQTLEGI
jgi:hypothetical protein